MSTHRVGGHSPTALRHDAQGPRSPPGGAHAAAGGLDSSRVAQAPIRPLVLLDGGIEPGKSAHLRCGRLAPVSGLHVALSSLGRSWLLLRDEGVVLDRAIRDLVRRTVPKLLARTGVGVHSAAHLLINAGGNPARLRSDAAFAGALRSEPRPGKQATTAPPPEPRRRPAGQQRAVDHCEQPHDQRSAGPRLRRPAAPASACSSV